MYNLSYFKDKDPKAVMDFIHQHPFALMAGCSAEGKPVATQIPVFIEEKNGQLFLTGHMMRKTDHHLAFEKNPDVLCVFTGQHSYVSATWYQDPHQASTWNYMSVHVRGKLSFLDESGLVDVLKKTTLHFENHNTQSSTVFDNLPQQYRDQLMKAIVAFEVAVESMEHVFKLSQNHPESYHDIIRHLEEKDDASKAVAEEMKKRSGQVLPKNH